VKLKTQQSKKHIGAVTSLTTLFKPQSVAVVGASPDLGKPGGRCLAYLSKYDFSGLIYPINPRYSHIGDIPCYPDFKSLPTPVDLVILLVPADKVCVYLEDAADAGTKAVVVCSSGFAEAGDTGIELQKKLIETANRRGLAVVGPNCLGMVDLHQPMVASFSTSLSTDLTLQSGPIAFVSQSGAMGMAVFTQAQAEGIAVGKFISTGNEAVLDFTDFLEYFIEDPNVKLILGYIEGVRDGRRFVNAARKARAAGKFVAILKVGKSKAGERASQSHTGALAGASHIYEAAFRRGGILSVNDIRSLTDIAALAPDQGTVNGPGVGIISMSGGAGVMMADACGVHGLDVVTLSQATLDNLSQCLPAYSGMSNPVDYGAIYGDMDAVQACITHVANDPHVKVVLVFIGMSPNLHGVIEQRIADVQKQCGKRIITAWLAGPVAGLLALRKLGVPCYVEPERAVAAAAYLVQLGKQFNGPDLHMSHQQSGKEQSAIAQLKKYIRSGRTTLSESEVKQLVSAYGIPIGQETLVIDEDQAQAIADSIQKPLAVKVSAAQLLHKSDAGAVKLNVKPADVKAAFKAVVAAASAVVGAKGVDGVLIQPMAQAGMEMLVGLRFDTQFGPTVTLALGGISSEVMADAVTELAPLDFELSYDMISRLRCAPLLAAFRGRPAHDREALAQVLVNMSRLAMDAGEMLLELDLNPVIVHIEKNSCTVVDGAAVLGADI